MVNCGWCKEPTKQIYRIGRDNTWLCPICAEKHYNSIEPKLKKHIEEIQSGLYNRRYSLRKLKQEMCEHTNLIDTGFGRFLAPMVVKTIYRCKDCDKEILK